MTLTETLATLSHHQQVFKAGLLVADLEQAMADLHRWLDVRWTPVQSVDLCVRTDQGEEQTRLQFVCSMGPGTVLELIQANPDGYYQVQPGAGLHHVGMWADDLPATSQALHQRGMALEAAGVHEGRSPALFAFHNNPYGLRIELVDSAMRPSFTQWLQGGDLAL